MARKILALVVVALVVSIAPILAYAASGGVYALGDLGISVSMPANALVFSRDVAADDPDLAAIGYTQQDMLDLLQDTDSYLEAIDGYGEYEIAVTMTKNPYVSMSAFDEDQMNEAIESIRTGYAEDGAVVSSCEPYDSGSAIFLKIYYSYTEDNYTDFVLEYYTIYDNKNISITMFSYMGEVTPKQETIMKTVVDGIQYNAGDPKEVKGSNGGGALLSLTGDEDIDGIISLVAVIAVSLLPVLLFRALGKKGVVPEKAARVLGVILSVLVAVSVLVYSIKAGKSSGFVFFMPTGAIAGAFAASAHKKARRNAPFAGQSGQAEAFEQPAPAESYATRMDARLAGVQTGATTADPGAQSARARVCSACGESLAPDADFCGACGTKARAGE
ncbi:MAG TPA: zinc ribbon domain-containing protein [Clostridia bacterium]|nr:zinc ribbon domain-containing protein [Clostridia bacterium]